LLFRATPVPHVSVKEQFLDAIAETGGYLPIWSTSSTLAPFASSRRQMVACPRSAAYDSGLRPFCVTKSVNFKWAY